MFKNILVYIVYILYHGLNLGYITFTDIWEKNRTIYQKSIIVRQCKKLLVASSTCANSPSENCSLFPLDYDIIDPSLKSSRFIHISYKSNGKKKHQRSDQIKYPQTWLKRHQNTVSKKKHHLGSFPTKKTCQLCHHMPSDNWKPLDPLLEPASPRFLANIRWKKSTLVF